TALGHFSKPDSAASLPKSPEEITALLTRTDSRIRDARHKLSSAGISDATATAALSATPDELAEREQLLGQTVIALDQEGRYLRSLTEIRRLSDQHRAELDSWQGFTEPPTTMLTEQLT